jgi:SAM-dependent methyltransferase
VNSHETEVTAVFEDLRGFQRETGETIAQFSSLVSAQQYRYLYSLVDEHVPPNARVLDWGCGSGHFSWYLAKRGHDLSAFSFGPAPTLFDRIREVGAGSPGFFSGSEADPTGLPFADESFDAVFSVGVLEHVRETGGSELGSLREIRRILRPGGRFLCFHFPNRNSYIEALARIVWRRYRDVDVTVRFHKFLYTPDDIERLCRGAEMQLLGTRRYAILPRNMFGRLPGFPRNSAAAAAVVNRIDAILERALPRFTTNNWFVARKPVAEPSGG